MIFPVQHGDTVDDSDGADKLQAGHLNLNSTDTVGIYDIYGSLVGSPAARCLLWQSFKSDLLYKKKKKNVLYEMHKTKQILLQYNLSSQPLNIRCYLTSTASHHD